MNLSQPSVDPRFIAWVSYSFDIAGDKWFPTFFLRVFYPQPCGPFLRKNPALAKGPPHGYRPKIDQNSDRISRHNLKNKNPRGRARSARPLGAPPKAALCFSNCDVNFCGNFDRFLARTHAEALWPTLDFSQKRSAWLWAKNP